MAKAGRIQHWKHGWIPLTPEARAFAAGTGPNPTTGRMPSQALDVREMGDLPDKLQGRIAAKLEDLTGMPEAELAAKVQANLARAFKSGDMSQADWYERQGADIGRRAEAAGLTREQLVGMVSVTSAKKRWVENVNIAEAIAHKVAADEPFDVSAEIIGDYNAWAGKRRGGMASPHPDLKPGIYRPSELPSDFVASKTPGMPRILNADGVIAAVRIARDEVGPGDVIGGPKQRSFVNNLMDAADKRFVTVDTWHYRAAMAGIPITRKIGPKGGQREYTYTLEQWADRDLTTRDGRAEMYGYDPAKDRYDPDNLKATMLAADAMAPQTFFQSGPSSVADGWPSKNGTYPWFVKQTQIAAEQVGASPNAMQSVAWYAVGGGL